MPLRDLGLLVLVCAVWASNNIVSKMVVGHWGVPPIFYAAVRFAIVAAVTFPWLRNPPRPLWRLIVVALLMGGGNFALTFMGLKYASPSAAAIVQQLGVPITTLLSVMMLGEVIHWRRGIGIVLTLLGALLVVWSPHGLSISAGLFFILAATVIGSLGAVMMKQMEGVKPMQFQSWVGLTSALPLMLISAAGEHGQWAAAAATGWRFWAAVIYSALVVSVVCHTLYYSLIQRYEANLIAPLTLMTPLATIGLGVWLTHDYFDGRMAFGAVLALLGVLIVALRRNQVMPLLLLDRNRVQ